MDDWVTERIMLSASSIIRILQHGGEEARKRGRNYFYLFIQPPVNFDRVSYVGWAIGPEGERPKGLEVDGCFAVRVHLDG